jgi:heat-inducible transcriptional repressor
VAESLDDPENARIATAVAELVNEHDRSEDTYLEGIEDVLAQPEFATTERMLEAVRHLGAYELRRVLPPPGEMREGNIRVLIGSENAVEWMHGWSVVVASYGTSDGAAGTLAVLGPTRMQYARTIPRVRYLASLMSDVLHEAGA